MRGMLFPGPLYDEAVELAFGAAHLALGIAAAERDAQDRRRPLLEREQVGHGRGAAQADRAVAFHGVEAPDRREEARGGLDVGDPELDALQLHESRSWPRIQSPSMRSALRWKIFSITSSL